MNRRVEVPPKNLAKIKAVDLAGAAAVPIAVKIPEKY
jgi:hypothetical protein